VKTQLTGLGEEQKNYENINLGLIRGPHGSYELIAVFIFWTD
jgi:hypothetical protein